MSISIENHVNIEALKRWVNRLSVDTISQVEIGGNLIKLENQTLEIIKIQIEEFSKIINCLKQGDEWSTYPSSISTLFYNIFIRIDNSSIRIADFYECLIVPSNIKTYKKIIQGFDYIDVGSINIRDDHGNRIATIGIKSDLIWTTFHEYFITENKYGRINHSYSNHEQYLSIQLFDVEGFELNELYSIVNEILLCVSMEYDMDFKIFEVDSMYKQIGDNLVYNMNYATTGFEQIPMLYLTNAINSADERLSYLSYYQVIEYFFVRAQNYSFLNKFSIIDIHNVNHNELRKVLVDYKKVSTERAALKLVLLSAVNITKLKNWLSSNSKNHEIYCNSDVLKIDTSKTDIKVTEQLVERVYAYRCSIAHSKGDVEEYIAIPSLSRKKIANELPLLKYLAFEVISNYSNQ